MAIRVHDSLTWALDSKITATGLAIGVVSRAPVNIKVALLVNNSSSLRVSSNSVIFRLAKAARCNDFSTH